MINKNLASIALGVVIGIVPAAAMFDTYFVRREPITAWGAVFRRGDNDMSSRINEIDVGSFAFQYRGSQSCKTKAEKAVSSIGRVLMVDNETVTGKLGLSRVAVRCQATQEGTLTIVYGASFDKTELSKTLHAIIDQLRRD